MAKRRALSVLSGNFSNEITLCASKKLTDKTDKSNLVENCFSAYCSTSQQWISKVLGEAETTEQVENLSYGANTIRDGVSLSQNTQTKPLILPTEIANLKDLEAFVRLPGTFPVGRVVMQYEC